MLCVYEATFNGHMSFGNKIMAAQFCFKAVLNEISFACRREMDEQIFIGYNISHCPMHA